MPKPYHPFISVTGKCWSAFRRMCLYNLLLKRVFQLQISAETFNTSCLVWTVHVPVKWPPVTEHKWGQDSQSRPSVISGRLFPVSPCLRQPQYCLTGTVRVSPSEAHWLSRLEGVIDIERVLMSAWCTHLHAHTVCTLIQCRHMHKGAHIQQDCNLHTLTLPPGEAEQREASWPVAWQRPSRWTLGLKIISNSEQMIKLVSKLQSGWRHQMQTIFWQRKTFWCLSHKVKSQRHGAEINTTVVSSSHGWWFLSRSRWGEKTLGCSRRRFSVQLSPVHT